MEIEHTYTDDMMYSPTLIASRLLPGENASART